jgi:uncharacterized protein with von Willebrand factor type A (vWA) domain
MQSLKLCLILFLVVPMLANSEQVYRTVDESGQVLFTDTPAADDKSAETIELMPGPSEQSVQDAKARHEALNTQLETMRKAREQNQQARAAKIKEAELALESAEQELVTTRELQPSDWQMTVSGKRRIKPEYFARVEQAEAAVAAARETLKEAKRAP